MSTTARRRTSSAESLGTPGQRYVVNGASLTTRQAVELVRAVAGRPRRAIRLPRSVATAAGGVASAITAVTGRSIPFCPELARTLLHGHRYDGSLATRELGLTYRPIEETIERTLRWYADRGMIRPLPTGRRTMTVRPPCPRHARTRRTS